VPELRRLRAREDHGRECARERLCATTAPLVTAGSVDVVEQLERLAKLREQGVLTEDEFQNEKQRILNG